MFLHKTDWFRLRLSSSIVADADDRHQAAGRATFFAVAEKKIAAAGGTQIAYEDVLRAQPGIAELGTIGLAKIQHDALGRRLMARRGHVEPLQGVGLVAGAQFVE